MSARHRRLPTHESRKSAHRVSSGLSCLVAVGLPCGCDRWAGRRWAWRRPPLMGKEHVLAARMPQEREARRVLAETGLSLPPEPFQDPADCIHFLVRGIPVSQNRCCLSGGQVGEGRVASQQSITFLKPSQNPLPNLLLTLQCPDPGGPGASLQP